MPINYKEYPSNWKMEIRPAVLERAGHRCEFCNVPNYAIIWRYGKGIDDWLLWPDGMEGEAWLADGRKSTRVILTIAHLDHDKLNHNVSIDRLKSLCQKCHLQYDMARHVQNRKYSRNHTQDQLRLDL